MSDYKLKYIAYRKDSTFIVTDNGTDNHADFATVWGSGAEERALLLTQRWNAYDDLLKVVEQEVEEGECYCADEVVGVCAHCLAKGVLAKIGGAA